MKNSWKKYKNGNSTVLINLNNGTKIRETKEDEFNLDFPESLDICCTTYCTANCPYCYAGCGTNGVHADIMSAKFIDTLHPYTEVALQFNDLSHPDLERFLRKLKDRKVIANITVNQIHFEQHQDIIKHLDGLGLIKGIGVSLKDPTAKFIDLVKQYPNAVIHTIVGLLTPRDIEKLQHHDLKVLILGYKDLGRGVDYKRSHLPAWLMNKNHLYDILPEFVNQVKVLSFDNLAIEQLDVKRILSQREWERFYMGDEGTSSMFVDLTIGKFGISSLCHKDEMFPIMDNVESMFKVVKEVAKK